MALIRSHIPISMLKAAELSIVKCVNWRVCELYLNPTVIRNRTVKVTVLVLRSFRVRRYQSTLIPQPSMDRMLFIRHETFAA